MVGGAAAVPSDEAPLAESRAGDRGYRRLLGPFDATMIVAGSMIGSGIFLVPAEIARNVGTAGWLVAVWMLTGMMTIVAARAFAELSIAYPRAGGQYVFLREAFGPLAGFLYGWTLALVIQTGTIAAVAVAFAAYLAELVPALGDSVLVDMTGAAITARQIVAVGLIALLTVANSCGLNVGKRIQNVFTVTKLAALAAIVLIGLGLRPNRVVVAGNLVAPFSAAFSEGWIVAALGAAMVGALFSADAWSNVTFTAAEVRDPRRTLPRALVAGTTLVVVLYLLVNLAYLAILPIRGVEGAGGWLAGGIAGVPGGRVATAAMGAAFGGDAAVVMALLVMVSTFGCANGLILAGPRLIQAMASDGLFFRGLAQLAANGVPRRALVAQGLWASLLALSGRYGQLLDYVIATALVFYALTMLGLLRLRRRPEFAAATQDVRSGTVLPVVYVALALAITVDLLIVKPSSTWPGFAIVACGLPAAFFWRRGTRTPS